MTLKLTVPDGYQANDLAPLQVRVTSSGAAALLAEPASATVSGPEYPLTLEFPATFTEGEAAVSADVVIYYCRKVAAELCLIRQARIVVPVSVGAGGTGAHRVRRPSRSPGSRRLWPATERESAGLILRPWPTRLPGHTWSNRRPVA